MYWIDCSMPSLNKPERSYTIAEAILFLAREFLCAYETNC